MAKTPVILFLHIPKAAGTTLKKHLYRHLCDETNKIAGDGYFHSGIYYYPSGFFSESIDSMHSNIRRVLARNDLRAVLGHFQFGLHRRILRPCAYITLLRDPVDRIISLYCHLNIADKMSLEVFVSNPPYREIDNDQTRRLSGSDAQIGRCDRSMLKKAKENLQRHFSVVGTTERFDETLILLKRRLGWKKSLHYYLKNVNPKRPPKEAFPQQTLDAIRARNAFDLELYNTAQALLDEALSGEDYTFTQELEHYLSLQEAVLRGKVSEKL